MLTLSVKVGEAVKIGDTAFIEVKSKTGRVVRLRIHTEEPVDLLAAGIVPKRFTTGITGQRRRVLESL
jgi:hypothetical protein